MKNWFVDVGGIFMPIEDALGNGVVAFLAIFAVGGFILLLVFGYKFIMWFFRTLAEGISALIEGNLKVAFSKLATIFAVLVLALGLLGLFLVCCYFNAPALVIVGILAVMALGPIYLIFRHLETVKSDRLLLIVLLCISAYYVLGAIVTVFAFLFVR
jgi:hypothetical protein